MLAPVDDAGDDAGWSPPRRLSRKLKLKPGLRAAVIGAAAGYLDRLAPPADVTISNRSRRRPLDWIQVFVRTSAELAAIVPDDQAAIPHRRPGLDQLPEGLIEDPDRPDPRQGLGATRGRSDLMWLSLVSVDDTWSAFGLRPYKPGEARQTFR